MLIADSYIGHREEPAVAERLSGTDPERVVLTDTDRRRSHVRTETAAGRDLGIVVGRDLRDGDVLETEDGTLLLVELESITALVLDFTDADVSTTAALEVGHVLGNRHWDLAVRGTEALFPVTGSREDMEGTVVNTLPDGVATRFEDVPPTTFDDTMPDHCHGESDHAHTHPDGHSHDHNGSSPNDYGIHTLRDGDER